MLLLVCMLHYDYATYLCILYLDAADKGQVDSHKLDLNQMLATLCEHVITVRQHFMA